MDKINSAVNAFKANPYPTGPGSHKMSIEQVVLCQEMVADSYQSVVAETKDCRNQSTQPNHIEQHHSHSEDVGHYPHYRTEGTAEHVSGEFNPKNLSYEVRREDAKFSDFEVVDYHTGNHGFSGGSYDAKNSVEWVKDTKKYTAGIFINGETALFSGDPSVVSFYIDKENPENSRYSEKNV